MAWTHLLAVLRAQQLQVLEHLLFRALFIAKKLTHSILIIALLPGTSLKTLTVVLLLWQTQSRAVPSGCLNLGRIEIALGYGGDGVLEKPVMVLLVLLLRRLLVTLLLLLVVAILPMHWRLVRPIHIELSLLSCQIHLINKYSQNC